MEYEAVIGLEIHVQLLTQSKMFCGCSMNFGQMPNSQTCPVCLGFPGVLPVVNKKALDFAIKAALALNCRIAKVLKFDRKNYFYPDLPKNFQISQYDMPLSHDGNIELKSDASARNIRIKRVHLEEDAGKLIHPEKEKISLVDFNRSGTPLLEIVTEPDLNSPLEAYNFLVMLKSILEYLEISDCNMEEGSLRCDVNVSIRQKGQKELGIKTEVKNLNSFKAVKSSLEFEMERQKGIITEGKKLIQETRLWDANKNITFSMRTKEEAHDYRYFPEPDLAPFTISEEEIQKIKKFMPEMPQPRKERFIREYNIPEYDAGVLIQQKKLADFFEECVKLYNKPKVVSNWVMGDLSAELNQLNKSINEIALTPKNLAEMLNMIDEGKISGKLAKEILTEMINTGEAAKLIVEKKGLSQISDKGEIEGIVDKVISENEKVVNDYKSGKCTAIIFLVGQVMKQTKGKANPKLVNEILKEKLKSPITKKPA